MLINTNEPTPGLIGDIAGDSNSGFKQMMVKLRESFQGDGIHLNYLSDFKTILENENLSEQYMDILMEDYDTDTTDKNCLLKEDAGIAGTSYKNINANNYAKLQALMQNSAKELLLESQQTGSLMPIVGLNLPLLKLYWIKNVWKDLIPTAVAPSQTFRKDIEREYVMGPDKVKHYLPESFKEGMDLFKSARTPLTVDEIAVPATDFDLITASGGSIALDDTVSRQFFVSYIKYTDKDGAEKELDGLRIRVDSGTNQFSYKIREFGPDGKPKVYTTLFGEIDFETGMLQAQGNKIISIKVDGYLSTENNASTISVGWDKTGREFTIPDSEHLGTTLTKERVRDEKVIYNIDSATKVTQQMVNFLGFMRDVKIQDYLDKSRDRIRNTDLYIETTWDVKPPVSTMKGPTEWKFELKETLDRLCMKLAKILQLEDIMFTVVGSQESVRLLDNVNWMYGKDSIVGGVKIGYNIGIYNGQRSFRIASSDRIQDDRLRIFVYPTGGNYMMYQLFEYQFCITNEYRTSDNYRLPSVCVFDRYLIDELIPIQGSIDIQNNKISSSEIFN